jgi:hypothetical protein
MTKAIEPSEVDLGRELINGATDGLLESALEPRAALGRRKCHFRKVPGAVLGAIVPGHNNCQRRVSGGRYPREPQTSNVDPRGRFRDRSPAA